jgi:hypothetical protein
VDAVGVAGGAGSGFRPRPTSVRLAWVVCNHVTREVAVGRVSCPFGGRAAINTCLECRLLEAVEDEWRVLGCGPDEDP